MSCRFEFSDGRSYELRTTGTLSASDTDAQYHFSALTDSAEDAVSGDFWGNVALDGEIDFNTGILSAAITAQRCERGDK